MEIIWGWVRARQGQRWDGGAGAEAGRGQREDRLRGVGRDPTAVLGGQGFLAACGDPAVPGEQTRCSLFSSLWILAQKTPNIARILLSGWQPRLRDARTAGSLLACCGTSLAPVDPPRPVPAPPQPGEEVPPPGVPPRPPPHARSRSAGSRRHARTIFYQHDFLLWHR